MEFHAHHFCALNRVFLDSKKEPSFALRHQDVEVLAVKILVSDTGEVIEEILTQLTKQIGSPVQIVEVNGSD